MFCTIFFVFTCSLLFALHDHKSDTTAYNQYIEQFYEAIPNYEKCLEYVKNAHTISLQLRDSSRIARSYDLIGWCYNRLHNYDSALHYYDIALERSIAINDSSKIANVYNHLFNTYKILGRYDIAVKHILSSYNIYKRIGPDEKIAMTLANLGSVYYSLKDYGNSKKYSLMALNQLKHNNDSWIKFMAYGNLIALFNTIEQYKVVDSLYLILKNNEYSTLEKSYIADFNYALSLIARDQVNEGKRLLLGLLVYLEASNETKFEAVTHIALGNAYVKLNTFDSAIHHLMLGKNIGYEISEKDIQAKAHRGLSRYYHTVEDYNNAYHHLRKYNDLREYLRGNEVVSSIHDTHLDTQKRESDALLKMKEAEIAQRARINGLLVALILLGILLLLVLVRSYIIIKTRNGEIKEQNKLLEIGKDREMDRLKTEFELKNLNSIISSQKQERKRIARDLHDRLGAKLATLKMLQYQNGNYPDAKLLLDQIVVETRGISHNLYSSSMEQFGLVAAIKESLSPLEETGKFKVYFTHGNLHEEFPESIGEQVYYIIQELITNTIRYAEASEIRVVLEDNGSELHMSYSDNGRGFDNESFESGLGINNIKARADVMGGKVRIKSGSNGVAYSFSIPGVFNGDKVNNCG